MRADIMEAKFSRTLMQQLHDQGLGMDAQRTLVSLCKNGKISPLSSSPQRDSLKIKHADDCRREIIELNFVKFLVDRLAKDKYFNDARHSLDALIKHRE